MGRLGDWIVNGILAYLNGFFWLFDQRWFQILVVLGALAGISSLV